MGSTSYVKDVPLNADKSAYELTMSKTSFIGFMVPVAILSLVGFFFTLFGCVVVCTKIKRRHQMRGAVTPHNRRGLSGLIYSNPTIDNDTIEMDDV